MKFSADRAGRHRLNVPIGKQKVDALTVSAAKKNIIEQTVLVGLCVVVFPKGWVGVEWPRHILRTENTIVIVSPIDIRFVRPTRPHSQPVDLFTNDHGLTETVGNILDSHTGHWIQNTVGFVVATMRRFKPSPDGSTVDTAII